ncbi:hypothetical protein SAMN04488136_14130 [Vibrio xiamenensis]|uniref:Cytochrome oxidase Cu insertion factor, SCO1/SenC/PrrC family n=1 Tax=Vibrio xiamenensis TaxID=861298 RepID=A0A1G8GVV6_9VIBR|nr:hypothetical protein [Vibrio xiamenensis]SDH98512.1 hypothetical protein SAMN04488136_14130 [Vibrio xiamenensis]
MTNRIIKGRLILIGLVLLFAVPVFVAKAILVNQWYQPGVTNRGILIEPRVTYQTLGMTNPFASKQWQLGYVLPAECGAICQQQMHLLQQSHVALGKYQDNVAPVVFVTPDSDLAQLYDRKVTAIEVSAQFLELVEASEYLIVDPLGQLVMRYQKLSQPEELVEQSQGLLADLRKMLKLSRLG